MSRTSGTIRRDLGDHDRQRQLLEVPAINRHLARTYIIKEEMRVWVPNSRAAAVEST